MVHVVILDEPGDNVLAGMEAEEFLLVRWDKGEVHVNQSDPGNIGRLELAARVLAQAMQTTESPYARFLGAIIARAVDSGEEQFRLAIAQSGHT